MPQRCWIDELARAALWREANQWHVRETGGALLGWIDGDDAVVARVLGPGPNAKHGFRYFEPDGKWQGEEGRRIYVASGRMVAYIGEWHTHPFAAPVASDQDRRAAKAIATDEGFRASQPLSAIIGAQWRDRLPGSRSSLTVYRWVNEDFEAVEIRRCVLDSELRARIAK